MSFFDKITQGDKSVVDYKNNENYPGTLDLAPNVDALDFTAGKPELTYIIAGPPRFVKSEMDGDSFGYVGLVSESSVSDNNNVVPVKGIGTNRHIIFSADSPGQINLSRVLFSKEGLMRAVLSYYLQKDENLKSLLGGITSGSNGLIDKVLAQMQQSLNSKITTKVSISLSEYIAKAPFGVLFLIGNRQGHIIDAQYAEGCKMVTNTKNLSPSQPMIMETLSMMCERFVPVTIGDISSLFDLENIA